MTAATEMIIMPVRRPPRYAPTPIAAASEVGSPSCTCGSGVQVGLHTLVTVTFWLPTDSTALVLATLSWNIRISVDAVWFPLSDEYMMLVVKVRMFPSPEQVASDSSTSEDLKLHEHDSRIASATSVFSICWVSFYKSNVWVICMQEMRYTYYWTDTASTEYIKIHFKIQVILYTHCWTYIQSTTSPNCIKIHFNL